MISSPSARLSDCESRPEFRRRGASAGIALVHFLVYFLDVSKVVNVHEAKTHFSKLLVRLSQGEEIVIGKAGRPVARLVPFSDRTARREPGSARGRFTMKENFNAPLPVRLRRFFGS